MAVRVDFNTGSPEQPVWSDITSFVRSVSFDRGKNESIGNYSAGNCSIVLDNRGREFDPTYASSPYNGSIVPRTQVRIFSPYDDSVALSRTNLITNPSFETNTTGWTVTGTSFDRVAGGLFGSWQGDATGSGFFASLLNSPNAVVSAGTTYTASIFFKTSNAEADIATIEMEWTDTLANNYGSVISTVAISGVGEWQRLVVTGTAPASTTRAYIQVNMSRTGSVQFSSGTPTFSVDGAMIEATANPLPYFDGSFTDDPPLTTYAWTGTANASTSTATGIDPQGYQFVGYITDWDLDYFTSGDATATIRASDAFSILSNQTVPDQTMPFEKSGTRINRVLDQFNVLFLPNRSQIDEGRETLSDDVTDGANLLAYLQQIEATEGGRLFVAKNGDLRFDSGDATNPTLPVVATFSDTGAGIRYEDVRVVYGTEQLANQITADYNGGSVSADNLTSQAAYGVTQASLPTLLVNNPDDAQYLVSSYVNQFGEPAYRIDELRVNLRALGTDGQRTNLATNPSLETDTTGWTFTSVIVSATASRPTTGSIQGSAFYRLTATSTSVDSSLFPLTTTASGPDLIAGEVVTASIWVRSSIATSRRVVLQFRIKATDTAVSSTSGSTVTLVPNQWTRITHTGVVPATATTVRVAVANPNPETWTSGDTIDVDGLLIETVPSMGDYFDGSTTDDNRFLYDWTGTANASTSVAVPTGPVVLDLELGDHVAVTVTPRVGDPITQNAEIVRISRSITDAETRDTITFGLDTYQVLPFILNSADYGRLDDDALGF